jgi:hypothetical protein
MEPPPARFRCGTACLTPKNKVERSHRVDDQEFYQLLDKGGITDDIHLFNEKTSMAKPRTNGWSLR